MNAGANISPWRSRNKKELSLASQRRLKVHVEKEECLKLSKGSTYIYRKLDPLTGWQLDWFSIHQAKLPYSSD